MARVKYTADGGHYRVAGIGFDPGDIRDVPDELADYLVDDVGEFAHAEATDVDFREVDADDGDGDDATDDDGDVDVCGVEMSDGSACDRPADECPYHGED